MSHSTYFCILLLLNYFDSFSFSFLWFSPNHMSIFEALEEPLNADAHQSHVVLPRCWYSVD